MPLLRGLSADLANHEAYLGAISAGFSAMPIKADKSHQQAAIAAAWMTHIRPYADKVPDRAATAIAAAGQDVWDNPDDYEIPQDATTPEEGMSLLAIAEIAAAADAFSYSVTRYADPLWGAGNNGYGAALDEQGIMVNWVIADENPCPGCEAIEYDSPYSVMDLPAWPGDGSTPCLDSCRCFISADNDSWPGA